MTRAGQSRRVHTKHPCFRRCLQLAAILPIAALSVPLRAADAPSPSVVPAVAGGTIRLDEVEVFTAQTSALTQAPVDSKLDATQPSSIISAQTINNQIAPTADYATIANIAPSVVNIETEGPGLSEAKQTSMRGFADGQYNVAYDGLPFGDANGRTHHHNELFFPRRSWAARTSSAGPARRPTSARTRSAAPSGCSRRIRDRTRPRS